MARWQVLATVDHTGSQPLSSLRGSHLADHQTHLQGFYQPHSGPLLTASEAGRVLYNEARGSPRSTVHGTLRHPYLCPSPTQGCIAQREESFFFT